MIYDLVPPDDPILRTKLEPFDFNKPLIDPVDLSANLLETMYKLGGVGLSANQVGLPYRVFVMRGTKPFACFNPRIILSDPETLDMDEGCLSFPNIVVKIRRSKHIKVRFALPSGVVENQTFTGMTARVFQHELSHLNGEFFFDGIGRLKMEGAMKRAKKHGMDYTGYNLMKYAVTKKE